MHRIDCPFCGPRAQVEFRYHCDSEALPIDWAEEDEQQLHLRLLYRTNEIGFHAELWRHEFGCGCWLRIERHNKTHEIRSVTYADATPPGLNR